MNCKFCFTALLGVKRNLEAGEIVGQIAAVLRDQGVDPPLQRVNLVFMGMGEPFLNYDNFMKSVRLLVEGVGIPESRMTVSTAGIVPRIRDFGREPVRPKLAISLNGSNDALRSEVMPLNRKWNLAELMKAAREFPLRTRERMTFEYVLIEGVNDAPEQAREVVELVRGMRARINLIALNPGTELPYRTPEQERVRGVPADPGGSGNSGVRAQAAWARHFRGLRPVEEDDGGGAKFHVGTAALVSSSTTWFTFCSGTSFTDFGLNSIRQRDRVRGPRCGSDTPASALRL